MPAICQTYRYDNEISDNESRKRRYGKAEETWSADKETNLRGSKTQS